MLHVEVLLDESEMLFCCVGEAVSLKETEVVLDSGSVFDALWVLESL